MICQTSFSVDCFAICVVVFRGTCNLLRLQDGTYEIKVQKNAIEGVHSMLNYNNIEMIIENHWGLIENSFGSLFLVGSGQNYRIYKSLVFSKELTLV